MLISWNRVIINSHERYILVHYTISPVFNISSKAYASVALALIVHIHCSSRSYAAAPNIAELRFQDKTYNSLEWFYWVQTVDSIASTRNASEWCVSRTLTNGGNENKTTMYHRVYMVFRRKQMETNKERNRKKEYNKIRQTEGKEAPIQVRPTANRQDECPYLVWFDR